MRPSWYPDWSGETCAIVGGGPSVDRDEVEMLKGRCRVAVINNSHELAPWADLLYAADAKWWLKYPSREFAGIKITADLNTAKHLGIHRIELLGQTDTEEDRVVLDPMGRVTRGGNSAFQLVNLLTQFGVKRQLWIGLDFTGEHWHGKHPEPLKNPRQHTLDRWRGVLDAQAPVLAGFGVEVINGSPASTLQAYPKMTVSDALSMWGL